MMKTKFQELKQGNWIGIDVLTRLTDNQGAPQNQEFRPGSFLTVKNPVNTDVQKIKWPFFANDHGATTASKQDTLAMPPPHSPGIPAPGVHHKPPVWPFLSCF